MFLYIKMLSVVKSAVLNALDEANELMQYTRLRSRPAVGMICSKNFVPQEYLLRKVFDINEEEKLDEDQLSLLRKKFRKNCGNLLNSYFDRRYLRKIKRVLSGVYGEQHFFKFVWDGPDTVFKMNAEIIVNMAVKAYESGLSWTEWFTSTTEAERLLELVHNPNPAMRTYGIATLFTYLLSIYVESGYDDLIFKRELTSVLPNLDLYFPEGIYGEIIRKGVSAATGWAFLKAVRVILQKQYSIPDEMFDNWLIQYPGQDEEAEPESYIPSELAMLPYLP